MLGPSELSPFLTLALIPLFAFADRRVGKGGDGARSSSFIAVVLVCLLVGFLTRLWAVPVMGLVWCVARSLPTGSTTPRTLGEIVGTLFRWSIPALACVPFAGNHAWGADWWGLALCLEAFALLATLLGMTYAGIVDDHARHGEPEGGENRFIEFGRGASFGAAVAVWAIVL